MPKLVKMSIIKWLFALNPLVATREQSAGSLFLKNMSNDDPVYKFETFTWF